MFTLTAIVQARLYHERIGEIRRRRECQRRSVPQSSEHAAGEGHCPRGASVVRTRFSSSGAVVGLYAAISVASLVRLQAIQLSMSHWQLGLRFGAEWLT